MVREGAEVWRWGWEGEASKQGNLWSKQGFLDVAPSVYKPTSSTVAHSRLAAGAIAVMAWRAQARAQTRRFKKQARTQVDDVASPRSKWAAGSRSCIHIHDQD